MFDNPDIGFTSSTRRVTIDDSLTVWGLLTLGQYRLLESESSQVMERPLYALLLLEGNSEIIFGLNKEENDI